jgi:hypothetical protein
MKRNTVVPRIVLACIIGFGVILTGCDSNKQSPEPPTSSISSPYQASIEIPSPPLSLTNGTYVLKLSNTKTHQPVNTAPEVKAHMLMSGYPMIAHTTITLSKPGEFKVHSQFAMTGAWTVEIKPAVAHEAITLTVQVQK